MGAQETAPNRHHPTPGHEEEQIATAWKKSAMESKRTPYKEDNTLAMRTFTKSPPDPCKSKETAVKMNSTTRLTTTTAEGERE